MTYHMFIDDERIPSDVTWCRFPDDIDDDDWVIVRNMREFLQTVANDGFPVTISFDHDLGYKQLTGHDIAGAILRMALDGDLPRFPEGFRWFVHSMNPVGAENIKNRMEDIEELFEE